MPNTKNKEATRYYSSRQEEHVASIVGGKRTPNSGASNFSAGDVFVDSASMLIECKTPMTEKESFSIKKSWIDKNKEEAFAMRMSNTALAFEFGPGQKNYFVISEELFRYLCEKLSEEYAE
jgi:hypothetical protein